MAVGSRHVRPEAVEKLRDGFSQRVERRRRQYAPRLQQAEQALALHRLGALEGVLQDKRQWVYVGERGLIVEERGQPQVIRWTDVASGLRPSIITLASLRTTRTRCQRGTSSSYATARR